MGRADVTASSFTGDQLFVPTAVLTTLRAEKPNRVEQPTRVETPHRVQTPQQAAKPLRAAQPIRAEALAG